MGRSETKINPLRIVVLWALALAVVFEKNVSAARMRGNLIKPESINSHSDRTPEKHAVEVLEAQKRSAKGYGIQVASNSREVAPKNEGHQSWSTRKDIMSNSKLSSSAIGASAYEIDYSGPSTHPPPRGH
ncbi:hypothetical protein O6H91_15G074300 [Diphasiastrum complanatum]|uniref:Uncharacterized protein n=1 Tax=Diphasiastrum complanatum TaxID=34168 RepID=A0ACC2BJP5_DIPCM|nr:hypothetical protein O6H91_Y271800 [Diphasiastrum complanatum]KAJ7294233.1 hypothetical protein O6H91_Y271800 [Diphasiastrum complanatum]KAJ7529998.1 hypothetical protein O6H91_15G074300 [Diphasiastrum complanatum]